MFDELFEKYLPKKKKGENLVEKYKIPRWRIKTPWINNRDETKKTLDNRENI